MGSIYKKRNKNSSSTTADRLATCSVISGTIGIVCSFFYLPTALVGGGSYMGFICGVLGIVLAFMSRNADIRPRRAFQTRAVIGLILGATAVLLTLFFFYILVAYYDALSDPVTGPKLNEMFNQIQQQLQQQLGQPMSPTTAP